MAGLEEQTWQLVENLLDNGAKNAAVYEQATRLLEKLKALSEYQDTRDLFFRRVGKLSLKYANCPSLLGRWRAQGWIG